MNVTNTIEAIKGLPDSDVVVQGQFTEEYDISGITTDDLKALAERVEQLEAALHHQHMRLIAICPDSRAENPALYSLVGSMKNEILAALSTEEEV